MWATLAALVVSVLAIGPQSSTGRAGADLQQLAAQLDLTTTGAARWLAALGAADGAAGERLLVLSAAGEIVAVRDGNDTSVRVDGDLDQRLRVSGSDLVLLHNHPLSRGLSADDLLQLAKRGVTAIVAVGHDGSIYMAARGRRFDADHFEAQYAAAREEVEHRVRSEQAGQAAARAFYEAHFSHLVSRVLDQTGEISYYAVLTPEPRASLDRYRLAVGRVVLGASAHLRTRSRTPAEHSRYP
jgi:hypothetical protein